MRIVHLFPSLILGLSLITSSAAQHLPPPAPQDPQAVDIVSQALRVAGGISPISAIDDYTAAGSITYHLAQDFHGSVTIRGSGMDQLRIDAKISNGVRTELTSKGDTKLRTEDGAISQIAFQSPLAPTSYVVPYLLLASALHSPGYSILYNGVAQIDGHPAHHIQVQRVIVGLTDPNPVLPGYKTYVICNRDRMPGWAVFNPWAWTAPDGTTHSFPILTKQGYKNSCADYRSSETIPSGDAVATDGSGYHMYVTNSSYGRVYAPNGTFVASGGENPTDTNGNYPDYLFPPDGYGPNPVDDLGRTLLSQTSSGNTTTQQSLTAPERDVQAVAILQNALAALGGTTQTAPASIVASGTYTRFLADSTSVSLPLRAEVLGYDRFRWEVDTTDQGTVVTVVSGTASWQQSAQGTDSISISQIPGTTFESFPALYISNWLNSSSVGVKMVGTELVAGNSVYHLSITPTLAGNTDPNLEKIYETTQQRDLFVDQKTNLPVRFRYYKHPIDWRISIPVEVEYSNFQLVSGIAFPMTVTSYLGDNQLSQIQYQSIKLNAPVAASDFVGGAQ